MGAISLVIMAPPRSGTTYMTYVLNACGLRTFHEHYYNPHAPERAGSAVRYDGKFAESSPAAYVHRNAIPVKTLVLHQMRHPLDTINSLVRTGHCRWTNDGFQTFGNQLAWDKLYWRAVDGARVSWAHDHWDRCAQFYHVYHSRIAEYVARRRNAWSYRVEAVDADLIGRIFGLVGVPFDRGLAEHVIAHTSRTVNRVGQPRTHKDGWERLTRHQRQWARMQGYDQPKDVQ